jgi:cell division initiation protein
MKISPLSIKKQEFNKSMRGYDKEEVQAFLEKLADDIEELQKENLQLKQDLEESNSRLSEFLKIEKSLQDTIAKTQESTSKSLETTKKQTTLMIKEAEIKASQIIEKASENANEIKNALVILREEKDLIVAKLKSIINSQSHLLEVKVEEAGEETGEIKKIEQDKKVDINVDDVVKKLL